MTPREIIAAAVRDGVAVALTPTGSIKLKGNPDGAAKWMPAIKRNKAWIVCELAIESACFDGVDAELRELIEAAARYLAYDGDDLRLVCDLARSDPIGLRLALLSDPLRLFYGNPNPFIHPQDRKENHDHV